MSKFKRYLGDGVYADVDELGSIILTTEQGDDIATNRIVLEDTVVADLVRFLADSQEFDI